MTARDLARWAAGAFASYDLATTHWIVSETLGPGPLPDYVSARIHPFTRTVELPRPVGVVLARVSAETVDEAVRRVFLTRNALLIEAGPSDDEAVAARVGHLAGLAEAVGAPAGVLQMLDTPGPVDAVLDPVAEAPVVVIADRGAEVTFAEPGAVVLAVGAGYTDLAHAVRAARAVLRETRGDRLRVYGADPVRMAAVLPVTRVALDDREMPPPATDGLITWTRISVQRFVGPQDPWDRPAAPVPAYPHASNESS